MRKNIERLAKEYEVVSYWDYVMETATNGQFESVAKLVHEMRKEDLREFAYLIWWGHFDCFSHSVQGTVLREVLNAM